MTPLELIANGFTQKDWSLVAEGYRMLTGIELTDDVDVAPVPKKRGRPKKVVTVAAEKMPKKRKQSTQIEPSEFYSKHRGKITLDLVSERPNWFQAENFNVDRTDQVFKKKVYKKGRTLSKPSPMQKKKYVCRKCGRTDLLYPSQIVVGQYSSKGYYCNSCCGGY